MSTLQIVGYAETSLCWATPVRVEVLGAHLEAYLTLSPIINTLRLCHRFGTSATAGLSVADLPLELIAEIERLLTADARAASFQSWVKDFKCFEQTCWPSDHLTEDALALRRQLAREEEEERSEGQAASDDDVATRVETDLGNARALWLDEHEHRVTSWARRIDKYTRDRRAFFLANTTRIRRDFGLEVWLSHVYLEENEKFSWWEANEFSPATTTIAYLKLPKAGAERLSWPFTEGNAESNLGNGYGIPVEVPKGLSPSVRRRFERMMKILDLTPFVAESQEGITLSVEGSERNEAAKTQSWPQLMLLVRGTTHMEQE